MLDRIQKVWMPRLLVAWFATRWPGRVRARLLRRLGKRVRVELYFAFDDPYAAAALPLFDVAARRGAELVLYPLVDRGIDGDPALEQRRHYAVEDARRLLRRRGLVLRREGPLHADDAAFLAAWTESLRGTPAMERFAEAALKRLWLESSGSVRAADLAPLFREIAGREPPTEPASAARVADNRRRQLRKGHWESPAARVQGEWFFAHERVAHIEERLAELNR